MLTRRDLLKAGAVGAIGALSASPLVAWSQEVAASTQPGKGKRLLFFTKSQGFPHSVVTRKNGPDGKPLTGPNDLAAAEKTVKEWAENAGYTIEISKEGSIFTPENIATFDAFIFYTTGFLTEPPGTQYKSDQTSAMTPEGKSALLKAIEEGKGFVGLHSASDTFESPDRKTDPVTLAPEDWKAAKIDPYNHMLGAEFTSHGSQQFATIRVGSKTFPGLTDLKEFTIQEEWYAYTNMGSDLHVILVQDTTTMKTTNGQREKQYQGPAYPETWARLHGKGRVFYTGMGHRDDVWSNPLYKQIVMAGLAWSTRVIDGAVPANIHEVCPGIVRKA